MQTQTIKAELTINGLKVAMGHKFLEEIASRIPDKKEHEALFEEMAKSDNYGVRESISRNNNLNRSTIHMLLKDTHQEVVRSVLSNFNITKMIEEEILDEVIEQGNIQILCCIAANVDNFEQCNRSKLAKRLSKHPNAEVRGNLLGWNLSRFLTTKTLKKLAEDEDVDVVLEAKEALLERGK